MGNFHHQALMISASVSAYTAPALMTVSLLTDYWIYGNQTKLSPNPANKPSETRIVNYTYHRIGLWRECIREINDTSYRCENVRYSKEDAKSQKGFKAVSYRSAPSMTCFTAASILLIMAFVLFTRGLCKRRRKAVFFISGLLFSISGLVTMVGVTLYVSITTEESDKSDQDLKVMNCSYGYSFLCAVLSFILQELTGVLTVYWFIYRFRALVRKQEKLRERTRQLMGNCLSMTTAFPLNLASLSPTNHQRINSITTSSNQNHAQYQYTSNEPSNPLISKLQKRRLPFDNSFSSSTLPRVDKSSYSSYPLPSSTPVYGDYCRVLIRTEDLDLLTQMVRSKSQAQLLANSRPTTPASLINTKIPANTHISRHPNDNPIRRYSKKSVKRTTSV